MGLAHREDYCKWTQEEDRFLQENYQSMKYSDIAHQLNHSLVSVRKRVLKKCNPKYPNWTQESDWWTRCSL
jgi:hypothetical protein